MSSLSHVWRGEMLFHYCYLKFVTVVQSLSLSNSRQPHGLQHPRLPCSSLFPWVCANSCPLSWWCHPTISFSLVPFSSLPSILPCIRIFSNESFLCIRYPEYWNFSFSFSTSPSNEYAGLISFRIEWKFGPLLIKILWSACLKFWDHRPHPVLTKSGFQVWGLNHSLRRRPGDSYWTHLASLTCWKKKNLLSVWRELFCQPLPICPSPSPTALMGTSSSTGAYLVLVLSGCHIC